MRILGTFINRNVLWAGLLAGVLALGAVALSFLTGETGADTIWRALWAALAGPVLIAVRRVLMADWDGDGTPNVFDETPGRPPVARSAKHLRDVSGSGLVLLQLCLVGLVTLMPFAGGCGGGSAVTYEPQHASIEGEFTFFGGVEWSPADGVEGAWESDGDIVGTYGSELCLAPGLCQPVDTTSSIATGIDSAGGPTLVWTICHSMPLMPTLQCHEVLAVGDDGEAAPDP